MIENIINITRNPHRISRKKVGRRSKIYFRYFCEQNEMIAVIQKFIAKRLSRSFNTMRNIQSEVLREEEVQPKIHENSNKAIKYNLRKSE